MLMQMENNQKSQPIDKPQLVSHQLKMVQQQINDQLFTSAPQLQQDISYIAKTTGKLLRPAVFLLSSLATYKIEKKHIKIAAVLEMIHMATLLHDDVIDRADMRRNQQTVNKLHGNQRAVLLGDYIIAHAFNLLSGIKNPAIQTELSQMVTRVCQGEILQNINTNNFSLTRQQYLQIITDKTASFFETACALAPIINKAQDLKKPLSDYGLNLGIAFQLRDDIIDLYGSQPKHGKTIGTDIINAKPTLPLIHFFENCTNDQKQNVLEKMKSNQDITPDLKTTNSLNFSTQQLQTYCQKAVTSLKSLPDSPPKSQLIQIANSLTKLDL